MSESVPVWRPQAKRDAADLAAWYGEHGGVALELKFIDALVAGIDLLARQPECGSMRHATLFPELPVPLRFHPLRRFDSILVYYMALSDHVEVLRVWHAARGLAALFEQTEQE